MLRNSYFATFSRPQFSSRYRSNSAWSGQPAQMRSTVKSESAWPANIRLTAATWHGVPENRTGTPEPSAARRSARKLRDNAALTYFDPRSRASDASSRTIS